MEAPDAVTDADIKAQIAEAKAELAVVLTESFREDINGLRGVLQHAKQLIEALRAENANLKAALAAADPKYNYEAQNRPAVPRHSEDEIPLPPTVIEPNAINNGLRRAAHAQKSPPGPRSLPRPDMQRVPPEGTIFSNGGPYRSKKSGEKLDHNARLKQEVNAWTVARGYRTKVANSRLDLKRIKLTITCAFAGSPKYRAGKQETAAEAAERRERVQETGGRFRKQRVSRLLDCPLKFVLLEIVEGSGTFVVKHSSDPAAQCCNHESNTLAEEGEAGE